jgi:methylamine---corrinoid protein Co-methyltransferase
LISLLDIAERSQRGPKMDEKSWNLALFRKTQDLIHKYDIRCPGDGSWFNFDDDLAYRAFHAAVEFISELGVFCVNTGRVVRFDEAEIKEAIREMPEALLVGDGRDARVMRQQQLDSKQPLEVFNLFPGHHAPFSEKLAPLAIKNFAQISQGTYLEGINFTEVDGREVFGLPMEVYAARREVAWLREGIRKAGRPGMAIAYYPINTRAGCLIAAISPDSGIRPTDGVLLSLLPDEKIEHDLLAASIVYHDTGCFSINGGGAGRVGSFVGGVEGAVIEGIARPIIGMMCYRDNFCYGGLEGTTLPTSRVMRSNQKMSWGISVVCQALNRFTNVIYYSFGGGVGSGSGPGTETHLWACAAGAIQAPINGANLTGARQARAEMDLAQTPLEVEFKLEVAGAALRSGLDRRSATPVLDGIAAQLNGQLPEPPVPGCYDWVHHRPSADYFQRYLRVKDELSEIGLVFD